MTKKIVFTKRAARSGKGYLVWLPKDIVSVLRLSQDSYIEGSISKLSEAGRKHRLQFVKRVAKSGRGHLFWLPKDITDFLKLKKEDLCEFRIKRLGGRR